MKIEDLDYNDEIVSIEEVGYRDTIDIEVDSEDHLFVSNCIYTRNSIGLPQTLDLYIALMTNEQLANAGRIACKQLKNRYRDENKNRYFTMGLDKPKMRFFHVEDWNKNLDDETTQDLVPAGDDTFTNDIIKDKVEKKKDRFEGINI